LKTRLLTALRAGWLLLTEVPGWTDAGKVARTIHALPIAVPFFALFVLVGWLQLVRGPAIQHVRQSHQPALALEEEIAALRLAHSDEQAAESAAATERLTRTLLQGPDDLAAQMDAMRAAASAAGWVATLHPNDAGDENSGSDAPLHYQTARGRLAPAANNGHAFASLLLLLDRLVPAERHGSLTRLTVRADDQGRLSAEFGVRFAIRPTHEKTP